MGLLAAGLVVAAPSEAAKPTRYHVAKVVPFAVTNPQDGTVVRGHVYLPDTKPGKPIGTVLTLSPYWTDTGSLARPDKTLSAFPFDWFLADGYAFAAVSLRGTGPSDGCMDFGGKPDQRDAFQVVEGLAKQPWSNGRVGMFGGSYEGWTQSMAVATHPPHLSALVPVSSIYDYWSLLTHNGAPEAGIQALFPELAANSNDPACPDLATHAAEQEGVNVLGDRDPYFDERYYLDDFAKSTVPVFVTNGLRDLRIFDQGTGIEGDGHINQIQRLWENLPKGNRQMLIGKWSHGYPAPLGMSSAQADAMFHAMLTEWWGSYLGDRPARRGRYDSVRYQDDQGAWHTATSWPPSPAMTRLPLSGTALLPSGARPDTGAAQFQSGDNTSPGPDLVPDPGPKNCGPTQVAYASAPVSRDVHLAGNFVADVTVDSTLPGGNLVAMLFAVPTVNPRLKVLPTEDLCSTPGVREIARGMTSLRHWKYDGTGEAFPVLTPTRVPLRSNPFATTVRPGERLVLVLAAHHSTLLVSPFKPLLTVHTGTTGGSSLVLPVVGAPLRLAS
jgi:predicted acyl esterase